jgi:hypothetical protein
MGEKQTQPFQPSDQATVWGHGTADRCPGGGDGVDGGRWAQRNQGGQGVRVGEVFVECIEKYRISRFRTLRAG